MIIKSLLAMVLLNTAIFVCHYNGIQWNTIMTICTSLNCRLSYVTESYVTLVGWMYLNQ